MSKGARSAAALAGFLIVAGAQLTVTLLALWAVLEALPTGFAIRFGVPLSIATLGVLGYATWRALHARHRVPAGVAVARDQAPPLWELVDDAARAAGVPAPDGLTIVADATAALGERTRLLGFIGGRRDLYLGLPLLQALEPAQLKAVVAHELGHGSRVLGRWAPVAYRGRVTVGRIIPRIGRRNLAGAVLRAYAGFYRRVDAPFSREQELAADRIAAAHAGAPATLAALRDLPALAGMQRLFHAEYVGPGWQAGYVPDDVFGGLLRVLAARTTEMTMLRARGPEPAGPWDTHPPMADRIAALTALAEAEASRSGAGGAGAVAAGPPGIGGDAGNVAAVTDGAGSSASTAAGAFGTGADAPTAGAASAAAAGGPGSGSAADAAHTAADSGSAGGTSSAESLVAASSPGASPSSSSTDERGMSSVDNVETMASSVDNSVESGVPQSAELVPDLPGLGRALQAVAFPPRGRTVVSWDECLSVARTSEMEREAGAALAAISRAVDTAVPDAGHLLTLAADGRLRAAAASLFRDESPEEATARITELLAMMLALAALRSGVARWRHSWTGAAEVVAVDGGYLDLAELAAAAADPETTEAVRAYLTEAGVDLSATAVDSGSARAQVVGGLVNLSADGERTDVLITDLGLLLVPGLPRNRGHESKRRLTRIAADGVPAGRHAAEPEKDGGRFVPFGDVAGVTAVPGKRKGWVLGLRGGGNLTLRPALDADELPGGWAAWEETVTFLAGTR